MTSSRSVGPGRAASVASPRAHLHRLADDQRLERRVLLDDAGVLDRFDERPAAAVAAGHLADRRRRTTRTTALSTPMPARAAMQCSTVSTNSVPLRKHVRRGRFRTFCDQRGDGGDLAVLLADERDAAVRLGGSKGHGNPFTGKQSEAVEGDLARNCLLTGAGHYQNSPEGTLPGPWGEIAIILLRPRDSRAAAWWFKMGIDVTNSISGEGLPATETDRAALAEDRLCVRCRYNLRGLMPEGRCPEWGWRWPSP